MTRSQKCTVTEVYLNIGILVKETNKSLHEMEKEINKAK